MLSCFQLPGTGVFTTMSDVTNHHSNNSKSDDDLEEQQAAILNSAFKQQPLVIVPIQHMAKRAMTSSANRAHQQRSGGGVGNHERKYSQQAYNEALEMIQTGRMKTWEAAKKYGIPRTTLRSAIKRRQVIGRGSYRGGGHARHRRPLVVNKLPLVLPQPEVIEELAPSPEPLVMAEPDCDTASVNAADAASSEDDTSVLPVSIGEATPEKINKAVRAVIINRQGMGRVAGAYGLPLDVLKTHVSLQKGDFESLFNRAVDLVKNGSMNVLEAAEQFALPKGEILRRVHRSDEPVQNTAPNAK